MLPLLNLKNIQVRLMLVGIEYAFYCISKIKKVIILLVNYYGFDFDFGVGLVDCFDYLLFEN